jgi:hypothetical protein
MFDVVYSQAFPGEAEVQNRTRLRIVELIERFYRCVTRKPPQIARRKTK